MVVSIGWNPHYKNAKNSMVRGTFFSIKRTQNSSAYLRVSEEKASGVVVYFSNQELKNSLGDLVWCYTPLIPALGRWRQADL